MGSLYALKSFTGSVRELEEDGFVINQNGEFPAKKGTMVFTDLNGNEMVILKESLDRLYVEVKVKKKAKRKLNASPDDLEQIAKAYGEVQQFEEDEKYIKGTFELGFDKYNK